MKYAKTWTLMSHIGLEVVEIGFTNLVIWFAMHVHKIVQVSHLVIFFKFKNIRIVTTQVPKAAWARLRNQVASIVQLLTNTIDINDKYKFLYHVCVMMVITSERVSWEEDVFFLLPSVEEWTAYTNKYIIHNLHTYILTYIFSWALRKNVANTRKFNFVFIICSKRNSFCLNLSVRPNICVFVKCV